MTIKTPVTSPKGDAGNRSIWLQLLDEYSPTKASEKKDATVLILGNSGCGARSLIARLQGRDPGDGHRGFAMDYDFRNVTADGDEDAIGLLHFWHLESPHYSDLLSVVLTPECLPRTIALIMVDLTSPHNVMTTLEDWYKKLEAAVKKTVASSPQLAAELQKNAMQYLAEYQALQREKTKENSSPTTPPNDDEASTADDGPFQKPEAVVGPGMLTSNLGIPIIVVGSKADQAESVVTRDNATLLWGQVLKPPLQILNFMQLHLRKWCLASGATLAYTSSVSNLNVLLLRSYINHRAFGSACPKDQKTTKPDAVYVPWGSDSLEDIAQLQVEAITDNPMEVPYGLVIRCPAMIQEFEGFSDVHSVEHQVFLANQLDLIQKKERDTEALKGPVLPTAAKVAPPSIAPRKPVKEVSPTSSGELVQKEAANFFTSMDKRYKR